MELGTARWPRKARLAPAFTLPEPTLRFLAWHRRRADRRVGDRRQCPL